MRVIFFAIAIAVAISSCTLQLTDLKSVSAADPAVSSEWKSVKAAIERRRQQPAVHEYEIEGVYVIQDHVFEIKTPTGVLSYEISRRYLLDFENGRIRCDDTEPIMNDREGVLRPAFRQTMYDGITSFLLRPPERNPKGSAAQVEISQQMVEQELLGGMPFSWEMGVFAPVDFLEKRVSDLSGNDCSWTSDATTATLKRTLPISNPLGGTIPLILTYVFDKSLDWRVVNYIREFNGGTDEIRVRYTTENGVTNIESWDLSQAPYAEKTFRVTQKTLHESAPIEDFQVPPDYLKAGMRVSKDRKPFTVTEAGTLVPWRSGQPLAKTRPWWVPVLWTAVPAVLLGLWWWRRRHQNR